MLKRYTSSLTLAVGITFGLFLLMQGLVATGRGPATGPRLLPITPFVRVERPSPEIETTEPLEQPEVAPPPERPKLGDEVIGTPVAVGGSPQRPGLPRSIDAGAFALTDGALLPIVAVAPSYPPAAAARNLEGYVVVEYTVTATGSVRDVIVVESTHPAFERAAIEAAYRFKYRPQIVNGEPVEVPSVRQNFRFVLDR